MEGPSGEPLAQDKEDQSLDKPHRSLEIEDEDDENYHPIEQVRQTVPTTDDPTQPVLTFRTWFLGIISCALLSIVNQFSQYRANSLFIDSLTAQIVTLPLGTFMARVLPTKTYTVPLTKWSFSLNPGPFNHKEHVLISIFANCGAGNVFAIYIITVVKTFYHRGINPFAGWLLAQTTQLLGYGLAGIFKKILVDSPYMWWPVDLVFVALFRTLHEKEVRRKGGLTRFQFFLVVFMSGFAYYIFPAYFSPSISYISVLCLIWKDSIFAQQLGSGMKGLGIGSFTLDWSTVIFAGDPIATPGFAILNSLVGFLLIMYFITPLAYYTNMYDAKKFPIFTSKTYDHTGHEYNISRVLNSTTFDLDMAGYQSYSKLYLSPVFAFTYGIRFATLSATITYVALYHGETIWSLWRKAKSDLGEKLDVHTRIMKKNYQAVPEWWFYIILCVSSGLSLYACEGFDKQLQLPWWGLLMASGMAFFFTLPIGILAATVNQQVGLNIITDLVIGYIYPGRPLANIAFNVYSEMSMLQALLFIQDFKLGHYMKIPPKSMFIVQIVGTIISSSVHFGTSWWLLSTVEHICDVDNLPKGSPWTCPGVEVYYNASIIWGVIGPLRMFTGKGVYGVMNWWFLFGALAPLPIYVLGRLFPEKKWIHLIHIPVILASAGDMFPNRSLNYISYLIVGIFFNIYVYKVHKKWWARHAYIISAALSAGMTFLVFLLFLALQSHNVSGPSWWGLDGDDHCHLASCPTAPGVVVKGCPELH